MWFHIFVFSQGQREEGKIQTVEESFAAQTTHWCFRPFTKMSLPKQHQQFTLITI